MPTNTIQSYTHTMLHLWPAGALLGGYESSRFKSKPAPTATKLSAVHILSGGPSAGLAIEGPASDRALQRAEAVVRGTMLTRFLGGWVRRQGVVGIGASHMVAETQAGLCCSTNS
jgi:hypothetical protein